MSQHDTLTLREALRSIQYEAASLADAQVIALQALNATYPARAALSATQPAQAAQPVQGLAPLLERIRPGVAAAPWVVEALQKLAAQAAQGEPAEHWHRLYLEKCQQYNDRVAQLGGVIEGLEAEAAQGAGEVVAIHPSWLDCWSFNECDRLARIWTAGIDLTKSDDHDNDLGPQWKVVMAIMLARLAHRAAVAPTQPAAGADVKLLTRIRKALVEFDEGRGLHGMNWHKPLIAAIDAVPSTNPQRQDGGD